MDNQIMIFQHEIFGQVEMFFENGKLWTESTATATKLGYSNPHDAINRHCRPEGVAFREVGVQTGTKSDGTAAIQVVQKKFIDEGNLYRLIVRSKLPEAQVFEGWVFDGILPTLRKTGYYSIDGQGQSQFINATIETLGRMTEAVSALATEFSALRGRMDSVERALGINDSRPALPAPAGDDAEFIRQVCKISPKFQIEARIYSTAPAWARRKADKYLAVLNAAVGLKGRRLKEFIRTWNQKHPQFKTSYQRVLEARKTYEEQGIAGLLAQYGKNRGRTLKRRKRKKSRQNRHKAG